MIKRIVLSMIVLLTTACGAAAPSESPTTVATVAPTTTIAAAPSPTTAPALVGSADGQIAVSAAASLTDAFKEIGSAFEARNPGTKVTINFGSSSTLRTQLEQGARVDVFASADKAQMDKAQQAGTIGADPRVFATNRLTIIVPSDNSKGIASLADLGKPGVKFVAAQPDVPVGQYALQIFTKAAQDSTYGSDFPTKVQANVVSRESDVRQIVAKLALGEGDAAIVYTSDVTPQVAPKLKTISIPDPLNVVATYPIAPVKSGTNQTGGGRFIEFVLSPDGQKILAKWGFGPAAT